MPKRESNGWQTDGSKVNARKHSGEKDASERTNLVGIRSHWI